MSASAISATSGTRGEWMSQTPGPMPRAKPAAVRSAMNSIRERAASTRGHVGVEARDRVDDLAELAVAHVRVDLGRVGRAGRGQPERPDRPGQVGLAVGPPQRQQLPQGRLVDLDDADPGRLQVGDLVPDRQRDLAARSRPAAGRRGRTTTRAW